MVLEAGETRRTIEFTVSEMDKLVCAPTWKF